MNTSKLNAGIILDITTKISTKKLRDIYYIKEKFFDEFISEDYNYEQFTNLLNNFSIDSFCKFYESDWQWFLRDIYNGEKVEILDPIDYGMHHSRVYETDVEHCTFKCDRGYYSIKGQSTLLINGKYYKVDVNKMKELGIIIA